MRRPGCHLPPDNLLHYYSTSMFDLEPNTDISETFLDKTATRGTLIELKMRYMPLKSSSSADVVFFRETAYLFFAAEWVSPDRFCGSTFSKWMYLRTLSMVLLVMKKASIAVVAVSIYIDVARDMLA